MKKNQITGHSNVWVSRWNYRGKASVWIPYLVSIKRVKKGVPIYHVAFNGGQLEIDLRKFEFIMLYGACGDLSLEFLDDLNKHKIILTIHRRNISDNLIFTPQSLSSKEDVLSSQILFRKNQKKLVYISRRLIQERVKSMNWIEDFHKEEIKKFNKLNSLSSLRSMEAVLTKRYWAKFYKDLDLDINRREGHPVNSALDACSNFLSGIVLRWVLFHKLSPSHGYLHQQTTCNSLVYYLMEPFRYIIEQAVFYACMDAGQGKEDKFVAYSLERMKSLLLEPIYSPRLRQKMARRGLLHGSVLSLRSYLLGGTKKLVLPNEGSKVTGGRKINVSYRIPGAVDA